MKGSKRESRTVYVLSVMLRSSVSKYHDFKSVCLIFGLGLEIISQSVSCCGIIINYININIYILTKCKVSIFYIVKILLP